MKRFSTNLPFQGAVLANKWSTCNYILMQHLCYAFLAISDMTLQKQIIFSHPWDAETCSLYKEINLVIWPLHKAHCYSYALTSSDFTARKADKVQNAGTKPAQTQDGPLYCSIFCVYF